MARTTMPPIILAPAGRRPAARRPCPAERIGRRPGRFQSRTFARRTVVAIAAAVAPSAAPGVTVAPTGGPTIAETPSARRKGRRGFGLAVAATPNARFVRARELGMEFFFFGKNWERGKKRGRNRSWENMRTFCWIFVILCTSFSHGTTCRVVPRDKRRPSALCMRAVLPDDSRALPRERNSEETVG